MSHRVRTIRRRTAPAAAVTWAAGTGQRAGQNGARYWSMGLILLGITLAAMLIARGPAAATAPGGAGGSGASAIAQTVALVSGDLEARSVWHAFGGRLRRCSLEGTEDYTCGPWQ